MKEFTSRRSFEYSPAWQEMATYDESFNMILVGDECVGKSSILLKFWKNSFNSNYIPTTGEF